MQGLPSGRGTESCTEDDPEGKGARYRSHQITGCQRGLLVRAPSAAGAITFQGAALSRSWESRQHCKDLRVRDTATSGSREFSLSVDLILKAQNCFPTHVFPPLKLFPDSPLPTSFIQLFSAPLQTLKISIAASPPLSSSLPVGEQSVPPLFLKQDIYFLTEERSNLDK